jgi:methionyl aminopeptidase
MTKQPEELVLLAESGRLLASVFELLDRTPLAGMSTLQINEMVERFIVHDLQADPRAKASTAMASC